MKVFIADCLYLVVMLSLDDKRVKYGLAAVVVASVVIAAITIHHVKSSKKK